MSGEKVREKPDDGIVIVRGIFSSERTISRKFLASEIEEIDAYRSPAEAGRGNFFPGRNVSERRKRATESGKPRRSGKCSDLRRDEARIHLHIPEGKAPKKSFVSSAISQRDIQDKGGLRCVWKKTERSSHRRAVYGRDDLYQALYDPICGRRREGR